MYLLTLNNMKKTLLLSALGAIAFSCSQPAEAPAENHEGHDHNHESMAPEEMDEATGRVFFANLENGDTVTNPVYVEFGVEGMEVRPSGEIVEGTGHPSAFAPRCTWSVLPDLGSDHLPISIRIPLSSDFAPNKRRFNF